MLLLLLPSPFLPQNLLLLPLFVLQLVSLTIISVFYHVHRLLCGQFYLPLQVLWPLLSQEKLLNPIKKNSHQVGIQVIVPTDMPMVLFVIVIVVPQTQIVK